MDNKVQTLAFKPEDDGITHINIWTNSKTELGAMLAHFYKSPMVHPFYGPFNSIEGFWHYIQSKEHDNALRSLSGMAAKSYGKKQTWEYVYNFQEIINAANFYKIEQNAALKELFINSTLPFDMYYLFEPRGDAEGKEDTLIRVDNYHWLIKGFEDNRNLMKNGERPIFNKYVKFKEPE